jgi:hypothetical protein
VIGGTAATRGRESLKEHLVLFDGRWIIWHLHLSIPPSWGQIFFVGEVDSCGKDAISQRRFPVIMAMDEGGGERDELID